MSASAKFLTPSSEVDPPDSLAVFVPEKSDNFVGFFGKGDFVRFEGIVEKELFVGYPFDFGELFGFDAFEMGKIEAQAVGFNKGASLADVIAQNFTQGPVQDMGCGVVALDGLSSLQIDVEDTLLPGEFDPFRFDLT